MENNIIEGNKAIAEFMGGKGHDGVVTYYVGPDEFQAESGTHLKYNRSWSWLMPVVEKIVAYEFPGSSDLPFGPDTPWLRTFGKDAETGNAMVRFNRFGLHEAKTLIEATWQAVVEFSSWYNQNQSK